MIPETPDTHAPLRPLALVVFGASGSGKSTLAQALATRLSWPFAEGDWLHPPENVRKMRSGFPLDDVDRKPWLENVARTIREARPGGIVVACSALKRRYRELIRAQSGEGELVFVFPAVEQALLYKRVRERDVHFMPASLVASQIADFEPPRPDEGVLHVPGTAPTHEQVEHVIGALRDAR